MCFGRDSGRKVSQSQFFVGEGACGRRGRGAGWAGTYGERVGDGAAEGAEAVRGLGGRLGRRRLHAGGRRRRAAGGWRARRGSLHCRAGTYPRALSATLT